MTIHQLLHWLAFVETAIVAVFNMVGVIRSPVATTPYFLQVGVGFIWYFLLWKLWTRPRPWALRVAIFLTFMIALQSYLWNLAVSNRGLGEPVTSTRILEFLLHLIPITVAAFFCFLLWTRRPEESADAAA